MGVGGEPAITVRRFEPVLESAREARRLVSDGLTGQLPADVLSDAMLCITELAANAALHARRPFSVMVRRVAAGVRIDVVDERPEDLPLVTPRQGTAADITDRAATGRGLLIVASLAARWGYTTTQAAKDVWVELQPGSTRDPIPPVVVLAARPPSGDGARVELHFRDLPVRAAVASGMELEASVRALQIDHRREVVAGDAGRLNELLDASAPPRLEGRHRALEAAGRGYLRFDLVLHTTRDALAAVPALTEHIERLHRQLGTVEGTPSAEVAAFRRWLGEETARQLAGHEPARFPSDEV
jgi:anti-sigma regulatory factor (Ser/Thr protein kinase)